MIKIFNEYQLTQTPKGEYSPPVEKQLQSIREQFAQRYGVAPTNLYIGPLVYHGQTFIKEGYVWAPLPETEAVAEHEGYAFLTGYDTEDPSKKT